MASRVSGDKPTSKKRDSKKSDSNVTSTKGAKARNVKKSEGSLTYRALYLYLKLAKTGERMRISDFDEMWGSRRRFLDIRNIIDEVSERVLGHAAFDYLDEDGLPAKNHNRTFFRLAVPELQPPHPRNFTVFPLIMELLAPLADTTIGHQFQTLYDANTASLTIHERQNLERQRSKFLNLVNPDCKRYNCDEIVDESFEALTRENTVEVTWRGSKPEAWPTPNPTETLYPLMIIYYYGELHLVASLRPPEVGMEDVMICSMKAISTAKRIRNHGFAFPRGLDLDHSIRKHFGIPAE